MKRKLFLLVAAVLVLAACSQPLMPTARGSGLDEAVQSKGVMRYLAKAYIFIRLPGPTFNGQQLGHVGWGYEVRIYDNNTYIKTEYYYGAVENPSGSYYVEPGKPNGGWYATASYGTTMFNAMKSKGYTAYKYSANPFGIYYTQKDAALAKAKGMAGRGYRLNGNNCMNASYDVLSALGAKGLASPSSYWVPKDWYNATTSGWSASIGL